MMSSVQFRTPGVTASKHFCILICYIFHNINGYFKQGVKLETHLVGVAALQWPFTKLHEMELKCTEDTCPSEG